MTLVSEVNAALGSALSTISAPHPSPSASPTPSNGEDTRAGSQCNIDREDSPAVEFDEILHDLLIAKAASLPRAGGNRLKHYTSKYWYMCIAIFRITS